MAASVSRVTVPDVSALDYAISSYIVQGYVVQNRGEDFVIMFKKKEFSVLWAVVGLVLCLIPLLIYLIVYAAESDKMVEIRIAQASQTSEIRYSDDGHYWWDASSNTWQPVQTPSVPLNASVSDPAESNDVDNRPRADLGQPDAGVADDPTDTTASK